MTRVDLLIHSAAQLVTCASPGGPRRGAALADVGEVAGGAVAVADGRIVAVGPSDDVRGEYEGVQEIDASGQIHPLGPPICLPPGRALLRLLDEQVNESALLA